MPEAVRPPVLEEEEARGEELEPPEPPPPPEPEEPEDEEPEDEEPEDDEDPPLPPPPPGFVSTCCSMLCGELSCAHLRPSASIAPSMPRLSTQTTPVMRARVSL